MAITTLDPQTALILIDLQKGILAIPAAHPTSEVVARASALAEAFRQHALPVILVNVIAGAPGRTEQPPRVNSFAPDFAELVQELNRQPQDHLVSKKTWGAFTNTGLQEHLKKLGVTQVVIAGVATSAGVESTARHAHENGFHVTLVVDAMTDRSLEAHENSVTRIFPRIAETGTTDEILRLLKSRSAA